MKSISDRRSELTNRQKFLHQRLHGIESELDGHEAKDFAEMATEREGDEVLEDLGNSAQRELKMIAAALKRIEAGEYGECVRCGSVIDEGRLDLLPATPFCTPCSAKH